MKRVVRRGVFETNSSSTHAVSIARCSGEETVGVKGRVPSGKGDKITSAYDKMLFYWGFECLESVSFKKEGRLDTLTEHMNMLLDKCEAKQPFDREKAKRTMTLSAENPLRYHSCRKFFEEDELTGDCYCGMNVSMIWKFLGFDYFLDRDKYADFIDKLLSSDVCFLTRESWGIIDFDEDF